MTWKSYTLVSGAGLLATWLVSTPTNAPERAPAPAGVVTRTPQAAIDIQEQAERLRSRVREETVFEAPARNPFRFGARPAPARRVQPEVLVPDEPVLPPADPVPPPPPIRLSGIATISEDGTPRRSAILITLAGVLQVHEGDAVGAEYRVSRIEENAVELVANDGSVRRLTLRP